MYALNWWDIIDEHFVLGGTMMFDDLDRLQGLGVDAVLNLCAERSDDRHQLDNAGIAYLWLPVMDVCPPTFEQIMQGINWIERQLQDNRTIYIHCAVGVGRSATLLACWLLYAQRMTVSQALHFLKTRRPQVGLTRLQIRRLEEFEAWLARDTSRTPQDYLPTGPATSLLMGDVQKSMPAPLTWIIQLTGH